MLLLISDANILIDMESSGLVASMFSLDCDFAVPDVLYAEELEAQHAYLLGLGLQLRMSTSEMVDRVVELAKKHRRPGRNDLFAITVAEAEACPLLTGDNDLRAAAKAENVEVRGTLWLVTEMVKQKKISVQVARNSYQQMREHGRRLPWDEAEAMLRGLE